MPRYPLLALAVVFLATTGSTATGCKGAKKETSAEDGEGGDQGEPGFKGAKSKKKKKSAGGDDDSIESLEGKTFVADLGFRPKPNGFGFANYSLHNPDQLPLGPKDLRKMCGDKAVCAGDGDDEECTLKAGAAAFLDRAGKLLGGGHCEGFSVGSLRLHAGEDDPDSLGSSEPYSLEKKKKVERYLAYWAVTQLSPSVAKATVRAQPNKILSMLVTAFKKKSETYVLGIYRADGMGGHAIAPYAVEDRGDDIFWVYVYENNSPGKLRHVEFDKSKNTWRYDDAATNPDDTPSTYGGDEDSPRIELIPQSSRNSMACPFATGGGSSAKAKPSPKDEPEVDEDDEDDEDEEEAPKPKKKKKKPAEEAPEIPEDDDVMVLPGGRGASQLSVEDEAGHTLGIKNGKLVNEIPGATYIIMRGNGKISSNMPPVLIFPAKTKVTLSMRGTDGQQDDVVIIGKKFSATMTGVALKSSPTEKVEIDGKGKKLSFIGGAASAQKVELVLDKGKTVEKVELPKLTAAMAPGAKLTLSTKKGLVSIVDHGKSSKVVAPITLVTKPVKGPKFEPIAAPGKNAFKPIAPAAPNAPNAPSANAPVAPKPNVIQPIEPKPGAMPPKPEAAKPETPKPNVIQPIEPKAKPPSIQPMDPPPKAAPKPGVLKPLGKPGVPGLAPKKQ